MGRITNRGNYPVETMMTENIPETAPDIDGDLFDELLATGTARRGRVSIYFRQAVIEELNAIAAEVEDLPDGPETISQQSRVREIQARWDEAYKRYEDSKVTFTVVPLPREVTRAIWEELPNPQPPHNPLKDTWPVGTTPEEREAIIAQREAAEARFGERLKEWRAEVDAQEDRRVVRFLAAAIEKVETVKGEQPGVTSARIEQIRTGMYGVDRINMLWEAFKKVSQPGGELDRPFSRVNSGIDQG